MFSREIEILLDEMRRGESFSRRGKVLRVGESFVKKDEGLRVYSQTSRHSDN